MRKLLQNRKLHTMLKPYNLRIVGLCVLSLVYALLQVAMAGLTRYVIDAALAQNGQLLLWGGLLVVDILAIVLSHTTVNWLGGSTTDRFVASLREQLLNAAVYSRDLRLQGFHSGQLLSRGMEDVRTVCDGMVNALPALVGQLARLIGAFGAVFVLAPKVTGVLSLVAVVVVAAIALVRPALKARHRAVRQADEKVMSTMQENLQQLELIQSLDAQPEILTRFDACQTDSLAQKWRRRILSVGITGVMNIGTLAGTGVLLLWGAAQVAAEQMSYGALTSMLQLLALFRGPVLGLSGLWTQLTAVDVAVERLSDLLTVPESVEPAPAENIRAVVFDRVTFAYPGEEGPVLEDFSIRFPLEQWSCLTGISGRGKSTVFKLILGLYAPQSGTVSLETAEGLVPCGEATRHLFAYVPQDFALFSGTIRENLKLVSHADSQKRAAALKAAQAEFVFQLSAGEHTYVGENNSGLSKGQLQRLAIARAILMDRPILLLDECTSALDAQTEAAVLQSLYNMGKQAILVTHRPEALAQLSDITAVSMEK